MFGTCSRKALLRALGVDKQVELHTDIMFKAGGEANEWHWERLLKEAGVDFIRGNDTPVTLRVRGLEVPVSGRPDIILMENKVPSRVLELKGVFSFNTAALVTKGRPKNDNLLQAAAYSLALEVPADLCYTSASFVNVPGYAMKEYGKSLKPFYKVFNLEWGETLRYKDTEGGEWVDTKVTKESIYDYYRLVDEMRRERTLGPRVSADYLDGTPHKFGEAADCKYCDFSHACERYDSNQDFNEWLQLATEGKTNVDFS